MAGKDLGKWRYWKYTTDHKVVGMQYLVMSLVLLGLGGFLAMLIRTELGATWTEVFDPNFYNSIIGTHGIVMVIAMIIVVAGPLGNFIVPIMIGARDMAFPRLNALSFWLLFAAVPPLVTNLLMGGMRDGWSVYQPLSAQAPVGMVGYQVCIITFAFSTGVASVNLITTVVTMRARGMTWNRVPVFAIGIVASSIMGLIWFPMFQYSQILALSDRTVGSSFFNPTQGGSVWLYENLFWLLGHPEVYVIVVPGTAALMELMVVFMRKPLFSYRIAVAGFAGIVAISSIVWVHHMYMTGWAPAANYPFMLSTELISIPFGFLVLVMLGTMWRGKVWTRLPMMAVYAVVWNKVIGGITGVYLSDTPVDQYMHGSMFVVAHFHFMLMGAGLFAAMGAIAFWFPKMTGRMLNERIGSIGFWTAFAGFQLTFGSMFVAGLQGMPRRVLQFDNAFNLSNWLSTVGAYIIGIGMLVFLYAIITSWRGGAIASANPWASKSLEWQTETPCRWRTSRSCPWSRRIRTTTGSLTRTTTSSRRIPSRRRWEPDDRRPGDVGHALGHHRRAHHGGGAPQPPGHLAVHRLRHHWNGRPPHRVRLPVVAERRRGLGAAERRLRGLRCRSGSSSSASRSRPR